MAEMIYLLCALTSMTAAGLLARAYFRSRVRLLMWAMLGFLGLAANSTLLLIDLAIVPDVDLQLWRTLAAFVGITTLVVGLIWEGG